MKTTLIGLGLLLAATTVLAAKPIKTPDASSASSISHLAAVDAEGKQVGIYIFPFLLTTIPERQGVIVLGQNTGSDPDTAYGAGSLYYELSECASEPYMTNETLEGFIPLARGIDPFLYSYPDPDGVPITLRINSVRNQAGDCVPSGGATRTGLVTPIPFDFDIVHPIRRELR